MDSLETEMDGLRWEKRRMHGFIHEWCKGRESKGLGRGVLHHGKVYKTEVSVKCHGRTEDTAMRTKHFDVHFSVHHLKRNIDSNELNQFAAYVKNFL